MATVLRDKAAAFGDRHTIEDFLIREARLLDDRKFDEWRELFTDDGYYWVPLRPDQESPVGESSLFYDDKKIMATRFERLAHPRIHAQSPPHRTCHVIGSIAVEEIDEAQGECLVRSSMIFADYRARTQRVFAGQVRHRLRRVGDDYRIVFKRIDLINCDDVFELIAVPF